MPKASSSDGRPSASTLKRLFALSGNRCAFEACSAPIVSEGTLVAEICHIKGHRPAAARHDSTQPPEERHGFENLILLCPTHHTLIDADPQTYSADRLQQMKNANESKATRLTEDQITAGASVLVDQGVNSVGQIGGIAAHTVNINYHDSSRPVGQDTHLPCPEQALEHERPTAQELLRSAPASTFQAPNLSAAVFFAGGSYQLGELPCIDNAGRSSDQIYWHYGPSAWLRLLKRKESPYTRAELARIVREALPPLRPFGMCHRTDIVTNTRGTAVVGYDGTLPDAVATRVVQVTREGEVWGLNRVFVEEVEKNGIRSYRVLWSPMKQDFEQALSNYLEFAERSLRWEGPITVVAGLACVRGAEFIRDKAKWFADAPQSARFLDDFVSRPLVIADASTNVSQFFEPFYSAVFDSCALDYADELRTHTWPQ